MALNNSRRSLIEWRRARVADGLRSGSSQRALAGQLNVSIGTINHDVQVLNERWRKAAGVDTETHRTRQLADLRAVKERAWRSGAMAGSKEYMRIYLQALRLEAQITGTIAPPTFNFNVAVLMPILRAIEASGIEPEAAGEAFEAWFQEYARKREPLPLEAQHGDDH